MLMKLPLTGGCQCGQVRYEIRAEPVAVWACHCTECQRQSGAAYALSMPTPRDAIVVTEGRTARWERTADSGRKMMCVYCPDCGTRLWHEPAALAAISIVKPGTLDDTSWLYPVGHIWTKSKQPWVEIPAEAIVFEGHPADTAPMVAAWKARQAG